MFSYNAALFVDDESAFDTSNDKNLQDEINHYAKQEEERIRAEADRAQAEQMRLFELQKIEMEARAAREAIKKSTALAPDHKRFFFCGIEINQVVFEEDEDEDLEFFSDMPLPAPKSSAVEEHEEERDDEKNAGDEDEGKNQSATGDESTKEKSGGRGIDQFAQLGDHDS